jgi:hypothetical protein
MCVSSLSIIEDGLLKTEQLYILLNRTQILTNHMQSPLSLVEIASAAVFDIADEIYRGMDINELQEAIHRSFFEDRIDYPNGDGSELSLAYIMRSRTCKRYMFSHVPQLMQLIKADHDDPTSQWSECDFGIREWGPEHCRMYTALIQVVLENKYTHFDAAVFGRIRDILNDCTNCTIQLDNKTNMEMNPHLREFIRVNQGELITNLFSKRDELYQRVNHLVRVLGIRTFHGTYSKDMNVAIDVDDLSERIVSVKWTKYKYFESDTIITDPSEIEMLEEILSLQHLICPIGCGCRITDIYPSTRYSVERDGVHVSDSYTDSRSTLSQLKHDRTNCKCIPCERCEGKLKPIKYADHGKRSPQHQNDTTLAITRS